MLAAPGFEQILEGFSDDGFAVAAADLLDQIELLQVVVDQELAHVVPVLFGCDVHKQAHTGTFQPRWPILPV
jgi:hypothetical protein